MQNTSSIEWFEIIVQDITRAIQFYESAFNIKFTRHDIPDMQMAIFPYQNGFTGGALVQSKYYADHKAGAGTIIIYLKTDSVSNQLDKIEKLGGETVFPLTSIGENGYIGGFKDCEGNYVGLWSAQQ